MMLPPPHDQDRGLSDQQMQLILVAGLLCYLLLWVLNWQAAALMTAFAVAMGIASSFDDSEQGD